MLNIQILTLIKNMLNLEYFKNVDIDEFKKYNKLSLKLIIF